MEATTAEDQPINYEILGREDQREILKRRVVDLVNVSKNKNAVIFLDKGARPLAHLFMKAFPRLLPDNKMPKIGFMEIGGGKVFMMKGQRRSEEDLAVDRDYYLKVFGEENLRELEDFLRQGPEGERLVVDDLEDTGDTKKLTMGILETIDPSNHYEFFTFIEAQDRQHFFVGEKPGEDADWQELGEPIPQSPWSYPRANIVSENPYNKGSFFATKARWTNEKERGLQIMREMEKLASEIPVSELAQAA